MSRRKRLEHEISLMEKRIKEAPKDTPASIRELWQQELDDLEFELNNLVDTEGEDNYG